MSRKLYQAESVCFSMESLKKIDEYYFDTFGRFCNSDQE